MRASRYPSYYDYNVVGVEGDPLLSAEELIGVADAKLGDLEHRRLDFDRADAAERVRAELAAAHWEPTRLVWMLHAERLPPGPSLPVEEVDYDAVLDLRRAWHAEDFPDLDSHDYLDNAREIARPRGGLG